MTELEIQLVTRTDDGIVLDADCESRSRGYRIELSWREDATVTSYWDVGLEPVANVFERPASDLVLAERMQVERWAEFDSEALDALERARWAARDAYAGEE